MRKFVICFVLLFALFFSSISLAQQNVRDLSITILFESAIHKSGKKTIDEIKKKGYLTSLMNINK